MLACLTFNYATVFLWILTLCTCFQHLKTFLILAFDENAILGIKFLTYFCNPLIKWTKKTFSNAGHYSRDIQCTFNYCMIKNVLLQVFIIVVPLSKLKCGILKTVVCSLVSVFVGFDSKKYKKKSATCSCSFLKRWRSWKKKVKLSTSRVREVCNEAYRPAQVR